MKELDTSWTMIDAARTGDSAARESFAVAYAPAVRGYFAARWARSSLAGEIDDAVQEVFIDCLRERGALERADTQRPFRPFLYGIARTIALRFEQRRGAERQVELPEEDPEARETRLSVAFDRAFAVEVMRAATEALRTRAHDSGGVRLRRFELLQLRFEQGLSIADIAERWGEPAARLHHLYAHARDDFRDALREVVKRRNGGLEADLDGECDWMLAVLKRSHQ